jgi:hypothetical protein
MKKNCQKSTAGFKKRLIKLMILLYSIHLSLFTVHCFSQTAINTTGNPPNPSAMLDASSTNRGMLISRMTTIERDAISSPAESLMIFNTTTNCFESYVNGTWNSLACPAPCAPVFAPTAAASVSSATQIVWNWTPPSTGATGYQWNTVNTYPGNGVNTLLSPSYTQTGLTVGTQYTLYVWAYNACSMHSAVLTLTATTNWTCGYPVYVAYTPGNNGIPATSPASITYNTQTSHAVNQWPQTCWLTQNLGATQVATSSNHASHVASGWYYQFNRSQAYDMADDGTTITPSSGWSTSVDYTSSWQQANDPCHIQLGGTWHVPNMNYDLYWSIGSVWANGSGSTTVEHYFNSAGHVEDGGYIDFSNPGTAVLHNRGNFTFTGFWARDGYSYYWTVQNPWDGNWIHNDKLNYTGMPVRCVMSMP